MYCVRFQSNGCKSVFEMEGNKQEQKHHVIIILLPSPCCVEWPPEFPGFVCAKASEARVGLANSSLVVRSPLEHRAGSRCPDKGLRV